MLLDTWYKKISYLGVEGKFIDLYSRTVIMANRINMAICIVTFALIVISGSIILVGDLNYDFYTSRLVLAFACSVGNLIMSNYKIIRLMKFSTVFVPIVVMLILPISLGYIHPASFIYGHLMILAISIIPHLVLMPNVNYKLAVGFYSVVMFFIDDLLILNYEDSAALMNSLFESPIFFKIIPFFVFAFFQLALFYMRHINVLFESNLIKANEDLTSKVDELSSMQNRLIKADKMVSVGMMSAGIAHEINNPLNFIQGGLHGVYSILNAQGVKDENLTKFLDIIGEGVDRTSAIVRSLSHFSRNGASMRENCNIHSIIDNCLVILNHKINSEIVIDMKYTTDSVDRLGSEGLLHQAFMNLLSNALYAMDEGGIIVIETVNDDVYLKVKIKDNGSGIEANNLSKIMNPFFTTKAPGEGTGLGLSITHDIIAEHGGKISVESQLGIGTEFIIYLPINQG